MRVVEWSTEERDGVRVITSLTLVEDQTTEGVTRAHSIHLEEHSPMLRYTIWEIARGFEAKDVWPPK